MSILINLYKNQYVSNIIKLLSGNVISQAINFLSIPILASIYKPSEFGVYGSLLFIINLCSNFIGLKYEVSVIHPKLNIDSIKLYTSSILIAIFFSIILFLGFYFFSSNYLIISLSSLSLFLVNANNLLLTRMQKFKTIALLRIVQTSIFSLLPLFLFFVFNNKTDLIINFLISVVVTSSIGLIINIKENGIKKINLDFDILKKYKVYPLKAAPSGLVNSFSNYFPVFFINGYFDSKSAGLYFLIEKLMLAPIGLISNAFSNVYRSEAQKQFHKLKKYSQITIKTIKLLSVLSVFIFTLLAILNNFIITTFFTEDWSEAILLIYIFIPFFATKFVSGPLMSGLYVKNRLGLDIILQLVYLLIMISSCLYGYYAGSMKSLIVLLSFMGTLYFITLIFINYKISK